MAYATREKLNAHQAERQRKRSVEEDFMRSLLAMGTPSSIVIHLESGECDIGGSKCEQATTTLVYPTETVEICHRHEEMRKAGKTR